MTKTFKTQQEIWEHLCSGGSVASGNIKLKLKDGFTIDFKGKKQDWAFAVPEDWQPYKEPKPVERVVMWEYVKALEGTVLVCTELFLYQNYEAEDFFKTGRKFIFEGGKLVSVEQEKIGGKE